VGNYYTRTVRIYPKNKGDKLNKEAICKSVVDTALLDNELNMLNDDTKDYLDLCFSSKRGNADFGLDLSTVDIWEIQGGDGTRICLNANKIVEGHGLFFFRFDEIEIKGEITKLDDLIKDIFPRFNSKYQKFPMKKIEDRYFHNVHGIYSSGCYYEIGNVDNRINKLNRDEFLKLKGEYNSFEGCLTSSYQVENLTKVYQRFRDLDTTVNSKEEFYLGLDYLQLNYNGRAVFQIKSNFENPYHRWIYKSSNWWDNCILPKWIKYHERRRYA